MQQNDLWKKKTVLVYTRRNYPTCGPTWGYGFFKKFTCPPRVNYLLALFKNYHAQGQTRGRFFSGPLTNIHLPTAKADFFNLLFDQNLPANWACIFPGFFAKNILPSFTEITLPVAQPEVTAFSLNLPARWWWIIYWFFFSKLPCLGLKPKEIFFWLFYRYSFAHSRSRFFWFTFLPKFTWLLRLHFSWLFCKRYPAQFYRNESTCGSPWGYGFSPKFTCLPRVNYLLAFLTGAEAKAEFSWAFLHTAHWGCIFGSFSKKYPAWFYRN